MKRMRASLQLQPSSLKYNTLLPTRRCYRAHASLSFALVLHLHLLIPRENKQIAYKLALKLLAEKTNHPSKQYSKLITYPKSICSERELFPISSSFLHPPAVML
jgi:hypothetical protein